ncbi:MAG: hypothetical protein WC047_09900, partial [Kiritimatiellales bacterium]
MQDLKNLSQKKSAFFLRIFGGDSRNRRFKPTGSPVRPRLPHPTGNRGRQLKRALLFIAIVLALAPLCVLALRQSKSAGSHVRGWIESITSTTFKLKVAAKPPVSASRFEI